MASFCLGFSAPALAEDQPPPADAPPGDTPTDTAPPADTDTAPAEPPPAESPEAPPPSDTASAGLSADGSFGTSGTDASAETDAAAQAEDAAPAQSETTTTDADQDRDVAVTFVGLERAPGSAYPSAYVRGIKHGSLWATSHGQQWPYLPMMKSGPGARVAFSGSMWNDLSYVKINVDQSLAGAGLNDQVRWTTQSRGVLRVTPTYNAGDDWFAQGNAELVASGDMTADPNTGFVSTTDDIWVRVGKWNLFDLTVGRFQGWEIANHYGMGLDINTLERSGAWIVSSNLPKPHDGYGLTYFWDRQNFTLGGYALHVYPTKYLRAEVLGHFGQGNMNAGVPYQIDVRPSAIFDIGWFKLKAGWEYGNGMPQDTKAKMRDSRNGFGAAAQFVLDPYVEFGGSFARGFQDVIDREDNVDLASSNTVQTFGGFLNASPAYEPLVLGFGAFLNHWEDFRYDTAVGPHQNKVDTNDQWLFFGAAQYAVWDNLYLKLVISHASNKVEHWNANAGTPYVNNSLSGRFRLAVAF
jgi:hypothetical protein